MLYALGQRSGTAPPTPLNDALAILPADAFDPTPLAATRQRCPRPTAGDDPVAAGRCLVGDLDGGDDRLRRTDRRPAQHRVDRRSRTLEHGLAAPVLSVPRRAGAARPPGFALGRSPVP